MNRNDTVEHATDLAVASIASKTTQVGAASVGFGWFFTNEAAVVSGIVIGVTGLLVNWWYRRKADKREEELHKARLAELKSSSH